jgi:phage head maturation protease
MSGAPRSSPLFHEERAVPEAAALIQRDVEFNIFSNALSADEDAILKELGMTEPDGKKRLRTTASSNIADLSGDEMTQKALELMRSSAEGNMTIFLNHKYQVPEDVLGSVEKATLIDKGDYVDLDFIVRVNESNPRAVQTHQSIVDGTKLGCSIGALIPKGGATKTETGLKIDEVRLLEASIVGIPANPRSFVQYATKALQKAQLDDAPEDDIESSGPPRPALRAADDALQTGLPAMDAEKATTWVKTKPDGSADVVVESDPPAAGAGAGAADAGKGSTKDEEPTTTKEAAPPAEGDQGEPDAGDEPATTEATQDAAEEASTPENDGAVDKAAVEEQVEATKALGIDALAEVLKDVTTQLVVKAEELRVEKEAHAATKAELTDASADLLVAKEIVEKIASLPLGRRTAFKAEVSDFRKKLSGLYSDDVIALIER